jgi:type II secretion system protein G
MKTLLTLAICLAAQQIAFSQQNEKDTLPPAPEGKTWTLVWHDEFDGTKLDTTKWEVMPDAPRKGGWWMRKAVSLDGKGHLVISTLKEGDRYIDGCVRTKGKFEHSFGYYVARVQLQKQPGHWSAFWIMGDGVGKVGSGGRDGTEIDIYEKPWLDDRVQHTLHWDGYGKDHKSKGNVVKAPGIIDGWHTFGLWWKPDEYVFYVDGKETWRTTASGVCQVPEYMKLSDEIGNWAGDIKTAKLPDAFLVDYVRVYDVVEKTAAIKAAKVQVELFDSALQLYQLDVGAYPSTTQGLQALRKPPPNMPPIKWAGPYLDKDVPLDPWGNAYQYRSPGIHNSVDVWSVGPDGKQIGNWK